MLKASQAKLRVCPSLNLANLCPVRHRFQNSRAREVRCAGRFRRERDARKAAIAARWIGKHGRISRGVEVDADLPRVANLDASPGEIVVGCPSIAGEDAEGQTARPVEESGQAPSAEDRIGGSAHAAAKGLPSSEGKIDHPVGVELVPSCRSRRPRAAHSAAQELITWLENPPTVPFDQRR